jgi:hypothetical protein
MQKIHHVALGFEDSYLITWRDQNNRDRVNSTGLPDELTDFLYRRNAQDHMIRNIPAIRCALGPYNSSFFVHDTSAYLWMSIPDGLLNALQARIKGGSWTDKPRIVALGADDNFLLITEQNTAIWDLENYKTLSNMIEVSRTQARGGQGIHNVILHPYRYGCSITHFRTGALTYENLPPHQVPGIGRMVGPLLRQTELAERNLIRRRESGKAEVSQRRSSALQERARIKREWSEHKQQFTAQSKGLKLSLSLSIGVGGLTRMLG